MLVEKYFPEQMYGFASDGTSRVFFHLSRFDGTQWEDPPTLPIVGEEVEVEYKIVAEDKLPSATKVLRMKAPDWRFGNITSFDFTRGFGFILSQGKSFYLHQSEILGHSLPAVGMDVKFAVGRSQGKLRACHAKLIRYEA